MNQSSASPNASTSKITDEGRRWIAENIILGNDPALMIQFLMQHGIDQTEVRSEINAALQSPYIAGATRLKNRLLKHDWVLDIQRKLNLRCTVNCGHVRFEQQPRS